MYLINFNILEDSHQLAMHIKKQKVSLKAGNVLKEGDYSNVFYQSIKQVEIIDIGPGGNIYKKGD